MPRWPDATRFDVALACLLAALSVAEVAVPFDTVMGEGSPVLAGALAVVASLALVARRSHPLAVLAVALLPLALAALLVPVLVLVWGGLVPMSVAVFSVARHGSGRTPYAGAGLGAAGFVAFNAGTGMLTRPGELFFPWLVLVSAWVAGWVIQRKTDAALTSQEHAREVEAASRERTLAALAEERARIARELHDIVAHTVTAMVVQAGAAGEVVDDDPEYVRKSLDRIRQTGSEALDEMRRVVALLRDTDEREPISPQPGLADLDLLVARTGSSRTQVRLQVEGHPRALPLGADLAAYRIVQEALTNVHRHSGATEAQVDVRYRHESVEIDVRDNGRGRAEDRPGNGLIGMRERASMYGGRVEVSSPPGEGFRVHAVLPIEAAP